MRLLLDESMPVRLRNHLRGHQVSTASEMGWAGAKNGQLLTLAAKRFDAFVTVDRNMQYQQNLHTLPIAVIVLTARSNSLSALLPLVPKLEAALISLQPRTLVVVKS